MAPECMEVYLRWNLEFLVENLYPLSPLQDLPSFQEKIGFKVIKKSIIKTMLEKKLSNDKSIEMVVVIYLTKKNVLTRNGMNEKPEN